MKKIVLLLIVMLFCLMSCADNPHFEYDYRVIKKTLKARGDKPYAAYIMKNWKDSVRDAVFYAGLNFAKVGDIIGTRDGVIRVLREDERKVEYIYKKEEEFRKNCVLELKDK